MRLILMGTGPFAVPTFAALLDSEHEVLGFVTRPVEPPRGRRKGPVNPVFDLADRVGGPIWMPEDVNSDSAQCQLADMAPDLLVVCDYGRILAADTLATASLGGVNLHGSLLPKYRGAAPINWAIWNGETETGVSVIHMTPKLDAGPVLTTERTAIDPHEDAVQLEERLAVLGVEPVCKAIEMLYTSDRSHVLGTVQNLSCATKAPRLKKSDGLVDWRQSAIRIHNQTRALKPWPGTFTEWTGGKRTIRLILDQVSVLTTGECSPHASPGAVICAEDQRLWVATGDGCLALDKVKPSGKRLMSVAEFMRGHSVRRGDRLGTAPADHSPGGI